MTLITKSCGPYQLILSTLKSFFTKFATGLLHLQLAQMSRSTDLERFVHDNNRAYYYFSTSWGTGINF